MHFDPYKNIHTLTRYVLYLKMSSKFYSAKNSKMINNFNSHTKYIQLVKEIAQGNSNSSIK